MRPHLATHLKRVQEHKQSDGRVQWGKPITTTTTTTRATAAITITTKAQPPEPINSLNSTPTPTTFAEKRVQSAREGEENREREMRSEESLLTDKSKDRT